MTTSTNIVTKTVNANGTFCYKLNGEIAKKASKKDYKYAFVCTFKNGQSRLIGLGNKINGFGAWKSLYTHATKQEIITIIEK